MSQSPLPDTEGIGWALGSTLLILPCRNQWTFNLICKMLRTVALPPIAQLGCKSVEYYSVHSKGVIKFMFFCPAGWRLTKHVDNARFVKLLYVIYHTYRDVLLVSRYTASVINNSTIYTHSVGRVQLSDNENTDHDEAWRATLECPWCSHMSCNNICIIMQVYASTGRWRPTDWR